MNKIINISSFRFQITLNFIATLLLTSWSNWSNAQILEPDSLKSRNFFTYAPITEVEFRNAFRNNYNAPFVTKIADTTQIEKGLAAIDKTYNDIERELAENELCKSPKCLTSFKAYYPTLDFCLFHILNYHYAKAIFVFASTNEMASGYSRFRGDYGVMSKDGLWVGLERQDADNYLQIEICKSSKRGIWSLLKFDFTAVDINEKEKIPMFWAKKNTIYIAVKEYDHPNHKDLSQYYAIQFK
jgi:hypothetical protein